jgi:stage II sporulation protein D
LRSAIATLNLTATRRWQPLGAALVAVATVLALAAAPARASTTFFVRGGGDGHGIGMSQYGAYGYALHGKDYRFILAHYYKGTTLAQSDPNRIVRVLLGSASSFSGASRADGRLALNPRLTYSVRPNANGTLTIVNPAGKAVAQSSAPLSVTGPGPLNLAGQGLYRGALEFRPTGSGVQTVEAVGLDDYVRGVISAEVPASWSSEALKSQAVAARTYAITTNVGGASYDVYPDTRSQMYRGVAAETASTDAAVAATRGQVVTYHGLPVVTYFFNSSGGHTENIENVWIGSAPKPWLKGVDDPYDTAGGDPYHHWGSDLSLDAAAAKLSGLVKGNLIGIRVTKHGSSPRILTADVVGTQGRTSASGTTLQHAFGLLTTNVTFTTISTVGGRTSTWLRKAHLAGNLSLGGVPLVKLVSHLVSGHVPVLHGTVFPGRSGAPIAVQLNRNGAWRTVERAQLGQGGRYDVLLPGPGTYRVSYNGLNGPSVSLG